MCHRAVLNDHQSLLPPPNADLRPVPHAPLLLLHVCSEKKDAMMTSVSRKPMYHANRPMTFAVGTVLAWLFTGCDAASPKASALPPTRDQIPSTVALAGGTFEFGFALGRLRTTVSTPAFSITKTPVTVGQYKECVAASACSAPSVATGLCASQATRDVQGATYGAHASMDNLPVTCAYPQQAIAYCKWVGGALPTIEEWHYAARGAMVQRYAVSPLWPA